MVSQDGRHTGYNQSNNILVLGDGDNATMKLTVAEENANYSISGMTFTRSSGSEPIELTSPSPGIWRIAHTRDEMSYRYRVTHDCYLTYHGKRINLRSESGQPPIITNALELFDGGGYYWQDNASTVTLTVFNPYESFSPPDVQRDLLSQPYYISVDEYNNNPSFKYFLRVYANGGGYAEMQINNCQLVVSDDTTVTRNVQAGYITATINRTGGTPSQTITS
jgi:hypothetical protein